MTSRIEHLVKMFVSMFAPFFLFDQFLQHLDVSIEQNSFSSVSKNIFLKFGHSYSLAPLVVILNRTPVFSKTWNQFQCDLMVLKLMFYYSKIKSFRDVRTALEVGNGEQKETSRSCIEQLPSPSAVKAEIKLRINSPRFKDLSIKKNIEEYNETY